MRAGVSRVPLPLEPGLPMMGYGARQGAAESLHDSLHARALYLEQGAERLLLVSLEVCLIAPRQAEEIAAGIEEATGLPKQRVLVACIHTHSGPETGFGALMLGRETPEHVPALLEAAVQAGRNAVMEAGEAKAGEGLGRAAIGRNRRVEGGAIDDRVRVVRIDRAEGTPLAVLYSHGCHPTVLGHDNLAWSADWPWAAGAAIAEALPGAEPMFLLSAHADVDPRTRGLQDLAIPGQSVGQGFDAVEALGREVGAEVARIATGIETSSDFVLAMRRDAVPLDVHEEGEEDRRRALAALDLPADASPSTREWYTWEATRTRDLPQAERRARIAQVRLHLRNRQARRFAFGTQPEVALAVLRLGPLRLLALPAEATVAVGAAWARRTGSEDDAVLSIVGGWLRYLPHARDFEAPDASHAYEVLQSTFAPDAADRLLDAGVRLLEDMP